MNKIYNNKLNLVDMKYIICLLFCALTFPSVAQVNRYSKPAESTLGNTYVSPDYNLLFELGAIAKQRKAQIESMIQKAEDLYRSYPYYPSVIQKGWHDIVIIGEDKDWIIKAKAYVNSNSEVIIISANGETLTECKEKIINGKSKVSSTILYFFEDIWLYNKYK